MAESLTPEIASVMFIAKVEGNPASFTINIINTDLNLSLINDLSLYAGSSTDIQINTQFKLTVAALALVNLDELILVVKYSF